MMRHPFEARWKQLGDVFFSHTLAQSGERLGYDPEIWVYHHPAAGFSSFCRRSWWYGKGFVETRRAMPSLPYSWWVRAGVVGIMMVSIGRVALDWVRLLRFRRSAGFTLVSLPAAAMMLLFKRIVGAGGGLKAHFS